MRKKIMLNSIADVKEFVAVSCEYNIDAVLKVDKYVVDAKSIMGIFSLDLSKPVILEATSTAEDIVREYDKVTKKFDVL